MNETLTRIAGVPLIFAPLVLVYLAHRWLMRWAGERPPKPRREASSDAEWIVLPFQLVACACCY